MNSFRIRLNHWVRNVQAPLAVEHCRMRLLLLEQKKTKFILETRLKALCEDLK